MNKFELIDGLKKEFDEFTDIIQAEKNRLSNILSARNSRKNKED